MPWNRTQPDWPSFRVHCAAAEFLERRFLLASGEIHSAVAQVTVDERGRLRIELLTEEAIPTSVIYQRSESDRPIRFRITIGLATPQRGFCAGEAAMVLAHLHRIDPDANMARFYCIDVAATLFGDVAVLRTWGRIGTHGRTRIETCASLKEAERSASQTLRRKIRRGYLPVWQALQSDIAV